MAYFSISRLDRAQRSFMRIFLLATLAGAMTGCLIDKDMSDLEGFVREIKAKKNIPIGGLPDFPPDVIHLYSASDRRDPFESFEKPDTPGDQIVGPEEPGRPKICLRPDIYRNKEHLEQYPFDALDMVGFLTPEDEEMYGLVMDVEGLLHQVRPGNYLGKNYGKVVAVSEKQVDVVEMVPDGTGCYIEREASLKIQSE